MANDNTSEDRANGIRFLKQKQPELAIACFQKALAYTPDHAGFEYLLGMAYHQAGQLEKATACYRRSLSLQPKSKEVHLVLAECLIAQNDEIGAEASYRRLLHIEPHDARAAFGMGTLFLHRNNADDALNWFLKALKEKPDWGLLHNNLGRAYLLKGDDSKALAHIEKAIELVPDLAEAWFNSAEVYARAADYDHAVSRYKKAIQLDPAMTAAHNNLGNTLKESKRYAEAIESFQKVLSLAPELPQGHYNLGGTYSIIEEYEQAVVHLAKAIQLKPDYAEAWNNLALVCKNTGDLDRARTYFNRALLINPSMSEARWNRSFVNFLLDDWISGWRDFDARFEVPHWQTIYPHRIHGTLWDGSPIPDETLLVHDEQGLGDTIQFARLLPWARKRCGRLILETRSELIPLLQNNPAVDQIIVRSGSHPPSTYFDRYIPLMSLARLAQITPDNMMAMPPYLKAEKDKIAQWKDRLTNGRFKVGIVWAGRPQHGNDANRSVRISQFTRLFQNQGIHFVGLQKGSPADLTGSERFSRIDNLGPILEDFGDTAAVLSHLDLLITVDTAVAHLAGAMGRPVWVLIPFIPDWRWGMRGDTPPWYPSMKLYRQQRPKEWDPVIERISAHLEKCLTD